MIIPEFIQALDEEIAAVRQRGGNSVITVYDGAFIRRDGPFFVYTFTTESPLVAFEDADTTVKVDGIEYDGQIVSVQGSEVAVAIEHDCGGAIAEAKLITDMSALLKALRNRFEEVLDEERSLDTRIGDQLFNFVPASTGMDKGELNLPSTQDPLNGEQVGAIRAACGSDVHFIWGPPGTGKTQTVGFLIAVLLRRDLRVLVVSHTNIATDQAIASAAKLLENTEDYQSGRLVRYGNISPNSHLPELVLPDKIAELLGQHLKEQIAKLQAELGPIQAVLKSLLEIQTLLARQQEALTKRSGLETSMQQCSQEHGIAKAREASLAAHFHEIETKVSQAQAAGKLKRFFLRLDPATLQTQAAMIESELAAVRRSNAAGAAKLADFQVAIDRARTESDLCERESKAMLSYHGLSNATFPDHITQLSKQADASTKAIGVIQAELTALPAKILDEAKVIATSLTKATISKQMDEQKFDVVVVDEASMAPMPSLYFAAGRAAQKVVVVGDFRQLPPIVQSRAQMAKKWLGRDIFDQAGIQRAVDAQQPEPRLTMLCRQYRMHPEISQVASGIIYGGQLEDSLSREACRAIDVVLEKSPFATTPLVLYDVSSTNPWSSKLERGGRYNLYSAVLSAELARRAAGAGIESVGVISPYAIHAKLIKMMLDDSGDAKLRHLKVSTVHKFQGLEQDLIIYDVAEGPDVDPWFARDTGLNSDAAKLINVAITRAKAQLVIVANVDYLASRLRPDSILMRVLDEVRIRGKVVDSREILDDYSCTEFDRWAGLLGPRDDGINPDDGTLYTERNFYAAFFADLRNSSQEIIIVSPFLSARRTRQFLNLFQSKCRNGVVVRVFTRTLQEREENNMRLQAEDLFLQLRDAGVQVVERRGVHQKFAFIDRKVAWEGSLNILSQSEGRSTEHMRRLPFQKTCKELIELHGFGSDLEVDPGTRRPVQTDRTCDDCGSQFVLVREAEGIVARCGNYPNCQNRYSIRRDDRIGTDVVCSGIDGVPCGKLMVATSGRNGVYLRCSDHNCKGTRNVKS